MNTSMKVTGAALAFGLLASGTAMSVAPASAVTKSYTTAQVAKHRTATNCWTIIGKGVYNLTSWVNQHPGGASRILSLCGRNGTQAFRNMHGTTGTPVSTLAQFKIGTLRK
jgi:cytochrome b involved in lipid metabolism